MANNANYATLEDLQTLWRTLRADEEDKAEALITEASSKIRLKAKKLGKDFDSMIAEDDDLANIVRGLVCTVVKNAMNATDGEAMTQFSQAAGGYSWSGTLYNPMGGIKITKADWKSIGLSGMRYGGLDIYA